MPECIIEYVAGVEGEEAGVLLQLLPLRGHARDTAQDERLQLRVPVNYDKLSHLGIRYLIIDVGIVQ